MTPTVTLRSLEPLHVLSDCKKAAIRDGWLLERWEEFIATARACLTPDAAPEELAKFMDVVRERFNVETK